MNGKLVATFLAGLVFAANGIAQWQHLPAGSPFVNSLSVDSTGERMLLSTEASGLWRSMNGGGSWEPFSTHVRPEGAVNIISQFVLDSGGDTVICLGRAGDAYWNGCTFDGGITWQGFADERIQGYGTYEVWDHGHNLWFFAVTDCYLYRSLDYGQTWNELPIESCLSGIHEDREEDSTLYVTMSYDRMNIVSECGLKRSTDLGLTWSPMMDENSLPDSNWIMLYGLLRLSNGDLIVTGWFSQPYGPIISEDDGATWHSADEFPSGVYTMSRSDHVIVEDMQYPGRLFMAAGDVPGGVLRSDDYGRHWQTCGGGLPTEETFASEIVQNAANGYLYAHAAYQGMYVSTDHGDTWQPVNLPEVGTPWGSIHVLPEAVFLHQAGESNPYLQWELEQPFTAWQELNTGDDWPDSTLYLGHVLRKSGPLLMACANIWSAQGTSHSVMAYSVDNGGHWGFDDSLPFDLQPYSVTAQAWDFHFHLLAITQDYQSVARSDDDGDNWYLSYTTTEDGWIEEIAQHDSALALSYSDWSGGNIAYEICVSRDNGTSWTCIPSPTTTNFHGLLFVGHDLYGVSGGNCVRLQDSTWEVRGVVPANSNMTRVIEQDTLLVLAGNEPGTLWISEDLGWTWHSRSYALPYGEQNVWLGGLAYDSYRDRLWGMAGVGVCYLDVSELAAEGPLVFQPADYTLLSVYPNPFNAEAKIRFDLLKREKVSVKMYDVLGREVKTVVDGMQEAGKHEVALSVPELASGVYFVRIQSAEVAKTEKIVLMK